MNIFINEIHEKTDLLKHVANRDRRFNTVGECANSVQTGS